jgi:hypothetical protein
MAAKIAALQFFVINEVRPIFPSLYQSRANWIFPDVGPFGFRKFVLSQQTIEYSFLPFPDCVGLAPHEALQASGELGDPRLPIFDWTDQCMKVIGHRKRSDRVPILIGATERFGRLKGRWIIKHSPAVLDAHSNEIGDDLVISEPDGYSRWGAPWR